MNNSKHLVSIGLFVSMLAVSPLLTAASGEAAMPQQPAERQQQQQILVGPAEAFAIMAGEAEKGSAQAMLTLGTFYEQGLGTNRNFVKALQWYERAAAAGSPEAYYRVGVAYEIGLGNTGNSDKSFQSFEKAAELNFPEGFYKLAALYITGVGVQKNESWGVQLLNRAVNLNHMGAANDLGVIYLEGMYGQHKDQAKAFDMFTKAAELGNPEAMKNLGVLYRDGIGKPADPAQELKWYTLAIRAGFRPEQLLAEAAALREKLGEDAAKKVDAEVESWIADFQARHQADQGGTAN